MHTLCADGIPNGRCDLPYRSHDRSQGVVIDIEYVHEGLLGYDERVPWTVGGDIEKRERVIVLVYDLCWQLTVDDLLEYGLLHGGIVPAVPDRYTNPMERLTHMLARALGPALKPVSRWLLADARHRATWQYETLFVAVVLALVAAVTTPSFSAIGDAQALRSALVIWLSALAVLGSFLHAKVGYRMAEALAAQEAPPASCHEWSGTYWASKELLWLVVFLLSGAYPAIAGSIIFILYPAWRRIHLEERLRLRGVS
jgi:hypothetical protein